MIEYLPYIFGLTSFLAGLYLFILSFGFYKPNYKTEKRREKYGLWLEKFGTVLKFCSVILILNGSYDLIKNNPSRYGIGLKNNNRLWTNKDKRALFEKCLQDAKSTAITDPQITLDFCECSTLKITNHITYTDYIKNSQKTQDEQAQLVIPVIENCINEFIRRTDSLVNKKSNR